MRTSMVGRSWHPSYSEDVRQAGVIGVCGEEENAQQVADRLDVSRPTLYSWKDGVLGHEAHTSIKLTEPTINGLAGLTGSAMRI